MVEPPKKSSLFIIGIVIVIGLLLIAGGIIIYFVIKKRSSNTTPSPPAPRPPPSPTPTPSPPSGTTGTSSVPLTPANRNLCYAEKTNPSMGRIVLSGDDLCTINSNNYINKYTIPVWSANQNNRLSKYNVWGFNNLEKTVVLPDTDKSITSTTPGWTLNTSFFALANNDVSSNLILEKYDVYSSPLTPISLIVRPRIESIPSSFGLEYKFSFYAPREQNIPNSDVRLCYAFTDSIPQRSYVYYGDDVCSGDDAGWARQFKIPVYSQPNALTTEYKIWTASNPDRAIITSSNNGPGGGWTEVRKFYAYSQPLLGTVRYCIMTANDPVRSIIYKSDDCSDKFGWTLREVFYGPRN
jgi:hypothetical protein